jgi:uncharacterized protein YjlB
MFQPVISPQKEVRTIHKSIPCGYRGPSRSLDCTPNNDKFLRNIAQNHHRDRGRTEYTHQCVLDRVGVEAKWRQKAFDGLHVHASVTERVNLGEENAR